MDPLLVALTVGYFLAASVTTLDIRLIQAKRAGALPPDERMLPAWVGVFHYLQWAAFVGLLVANWKLALAVFAIKSALKVLPVLEVVGNLLMSPVKRRA